jgi:hypothetical protein
MPGASDVTSEGTTMESVDLPTLFLILVAALVLFGPGGILRSRGGGNRD